MTPPTDDDRRRMREHAARATIRARAVLQPGDRLRVACCGGRQVTVTFRAWEGDWIASGTLYGIAAINISKRNGEPISFADPAPATEEAKP